MSANPTSSNTMNDTTSNNTGTTSTATNKTTTKDNSSILPVQNELSSALSILTKLNEVNSEILSFDSLLE